MPLRKGAEAIFMGSFGGLAAFNKAATTSLSKDQAVRAHKGGVKQVFLPMQKTDHFLRVLSSFFFPIPAIPFLPVGTSKLCFPEETQHSGSGLRRGSFSREGPF